MKIKSELVASPSSRVYAAWLREFPCQAQAHPGTLKSKHTNNALPVRVINGNREFVRIKRLLLEERQHALEEIYRYVSD